MFKRALLSIINQKLKTVLLIIVSSLLFTSLSAVFILKSVSSEIEESLDSSINPTIVTYSPLTIKSNREFISKTDNGTYENAFEFYNDLDNIYNNISKATSYDINIVTNGYVFLLPEFNGNILYQSSMLVDLFSIELAISSFERIVSGNTISGGNYYRLASTLNKEVNSDLLTKSGELMGRFFSDVEILNGSNKIILSAPAYYLDGENIKEINIGDNITYNLYVNEVEGRSAIKSYEFEVIGIYSGSEEEGYNVNFICDKTFNRIIDDLVMLVDNGLIDEEFLSFLPSIAKYNKLDNILRFNEAINDLNNDGKEYEYVSDVDEYMTLYGEIRSIAYSFNIMLMFAFILICIVLFSLINLEINQRKNEIATWMSIGMKKKEISFSFSLEYIIIFTIGFIFSLIISYFFLLNYLPQIINLSYTTLDFSLLDYLKIDDMMWLIIAAALVMLLSLIWTFYRMSKLSIKEILCK